MRILITGAAGNVGKGMVADCPSLAHLDAEEDETAVAAKRCPY
jgi:hypothetical protein